MNLIFFYTNSTYFLEMSLKKRISNSSLTNSRKRLRNSSSESIVDTPSTSHLMNTLMKLDVDEVFGRSTNGTTENSERSIPWNRFYQFLNVSFFLSRYFNVVFFSMYQIFQLKTKKFLKKKVIVCFRHYSHLNNYKSGLI